MWRLSHKAIEVVGREGQWIIVLLCHRGVTRVEYIWFVLWMNVMLRKAMESAKNNVFKIIQKFSKTRSLIPKPKLPL